MPYRRCSTGGKGRMSAAAAKAAATWGFFVRFAFTATVPVPCNADVSSGAAACTACATLQG